MSSITAAEDGNIRLTLGVVISVLVLAMISFALRIWARFSTGAKLWLDDYWMFFVMAECFALSTFDFLELRYGSGIHQSALPPDEVTIFIKLLWVYMLLWAVGVFAVKVGILLFYWRVFQRTRSFRVGAIAVGLLSTGIFFSNLFSFAFQCTPVEKFWMPDLPGHCINQNAFYLASAIINVFGDIAVLSLPLPIIWNLQASKGKKWSISFLFLLGAFVVIASVFRIVAVTQIVPSDFSFTNVGGALWSTVEVEVGFICANLPAVRPLLFKLMGWGNNTQNASSGTPKFSLSISKQRIGQRRFKMHSKGRDTLTEDDIDESSTDALNAPGFSNAIHMTKVGARSDTWRDDKNDLMSKNDIVVKTDLTIVNEPQTVASSGRVPSGDHFYRTSTAYDQSHTDRI
ncbi:hypothetical protein F5Y16DRAFT_361110 [Xylariaceae sp. FL0255]|nr:hypothetical protein F5Y16DRAFT_361110 [Xylariaceae sp. FL0255]